MDYLSAIEERCSRRKYTGPALPARIVEALQASVQRYNQMSGLSMELITQNGDAFKGFRKSYGVFAGVQNYIALIGEQGDEHRMEKEGYYGEKLVLESTLLGLGSCWVGSSYDASACTCQINENQVLDCVIAVGYVEDSLSGKEKMMARMMEKKRKSMDQLCTVEGGAEPWFWRGMDALQKAPSARNLQPVHIACQNGTIRAGIENIQGRQPVDLGIANCILRLGRTKAAGNGEIMRYIPAETNDSKS